MNVANGANVVAADDQLLSVLAPLFAAGWSMQLATVPGGLSLTRSWAADSSVVVDEIHLGAGGPAEAVRRFKAGRCSPSDNTDEWVRRWQHEGAVADVVEAFRTQPEPDGHTLRAPEPLPLGEHTARVEVFFHLRGDWECVHGDDDGLLYRYRLGIGSDDLDRVRVDQREHLGLEPLSCRIGPDLEVRIAPSGVNNGCPNHQRGQTACVGFDDPALRGVLAAHELSACGADLHGLAYCVVFGSCSLRELSPDELGDL
jgi:hypothetical protein